MRRCIICGHGLREMIHFEPDNENEPYYYVDVCFECYEKMTKIKEEMKHE
jgi:hypothetical protein